VHRIPSQQPCSIPARRPSVLIVVGYYDAFSGYQEVNLARGFAKLGAAVTVISGDRVAPIFSEATVSSLGLSRYYARGASEDGDVHIFRVGYRKVSSLLLSVAVFSAARRSHSDIVLVLGVGQGFSVPAAWLSTGIRMTIFGDNRAQWVGLSPVRAALKRAAFACTKGVLYRVVIGRCDRVYVNTLNTRSRIRPFAGGAELPVLPLPVDETIFYPDEHVRNNKRAELGITDEKVIAIVGKVSSEKRIDVVLDVLETIDHLNLVIILSGLGNDPYSALIRNKVQQSKSLSQRVRLLGYLNSHELACVMRAADICVWPLQPAITIQQAMVSGCRVIVPDNDLVGFLVKNEARGATFRERDFDSLRDVVIDQVSKRENASIRHSRAELNAGFRAVDTARRILSELGWPPTDHSAGPLIDS